MKLRIFSLLLVVSGLLISSTPCLADVADCPNEIDGNYSINDSFLEPFFKFQSQRANETYAYQIEFYNQSGQIVRTLSGFIRNESTQSAASQFCQDQTLFLDIPTDLRELFQAEKIQISQESRGKINIWVTQEGIPFHVPVTPVLSADPHSFHKSVVRGQTWFHRSDFPPEQIEKSLKVLDSLLMPPPPAPAAAAPKNQMQKMPLGSRKDVPWKANQTKFTLKSGIKKEKRKRNQIQKQDPNPAPQSH